MPIRIEPYAIDRVDASRAFVKRLRAGGVDAYGVGDSPVSNWLPAAPGEELFEEYFLANDGDEVRGGYVLKHQPFAVGRSERTERIGFYYSPISEGIIEPRYSSLGMRLTADAVKRSPLLFCLGMGGLHNPLPKLLAALGWTLTAVPFFIRIVRPRPFLNNLAYARRFPGGKLATGLLAQTGLGWAGATTMNGLLTRSPARRTEITWSLVPELPEAVDEIWNKARGSYSFIAARDHHSLSRLYPARFKSQSRLLVSRAGRLIGWAVVMHTPMRNHSFFGDAVLGSIVDCLALPGHEHDVVHAAMEMLAEKKVDLIVSNQSHHAWCSALRRSGWLPGPSNFIFAVSPKLAARLSPFDEMKSEFHLTRGDGEGPSNL